MSQGTPHPRRIHHNALQSPPSPATVLVQMRRATFKDSEQAQLALHAAKPQIFAIYQTLLRPFNMNDQWRNADAIVDVVSCGLWISHPTYTAVLHASSQPSLPNFWQICSPPAVVRWSLAYILRPIPCDGVAGERATSRYGITLDLKNMDYPALDDRHPHSRSMFQYGSFLLPSHTKWH